MESMGMFIFGVTGTTSSNGICVSMFIFGCIRAIDMGTFEYKHRQSDKDSIGTRSWVHPNINIDTDSNVTRVQHKHGKHSHRFHWNKGTFKT